MQSNVTDRRWVGAALARGPLRPCCGPAERHPWPDPQRLDDDVNGSLTFDKLRCGLDRLSDPPVGITYSEWEQIAAGLTVGCDGEEQLVLAGFRLMMRKELVRPCRYTARPYTMHISNLDAALIWMQPAFKILFPPLYKLLHWIETAAASAF